MKKKICKHCGKEFEPFNSLQKVCAKYRCIKGYANAKKKEKHLRLKKEVKDYKKSAWREYSYWRRYSDPSRTVIDGKVKCFTCDKWMLPSESDLGHFKHGKLDYDPRSTRIQCSRCNRYLSGNLSEFRKNLIRDHGEEWVEQLELDASKCEPMKQWQHQEVFEKYKKLNKESQCQIK